MTNTNTNNKEYSADDVGASFVRSYYSTLTKKPQKLELLYKSDSQITHCVDAETSVHYTGDQISPALFEFTSGLAKDVKVKLHFVGCQSSLDNSVLVLVDGSFQKNTASDIIQFSQVFVLAPQKNGYYVLNDILRLELPKPQNLLNGSSSVSTRDELDSTAATQGEGSVVSASQLDQEDVLSSDSNLNAGVNESKFEKEEATEEEKPKKAKEEAEIDPFSKQMSSDTGIKSNKEESVSRAPEGETGKPDKKKNRKARSDLKQSQETEKDSKKSNGPKRNYDAPTTYASIVGAEEYTSEEPLKQEQKPNTEKKKTEKKKSEETSAPASSSFTKDEKPKRKKNTEKRIKAYEIASPTATENGGASSTTQSSETEQPFEKKKSRFDKTKKSRFESSKGKKEWRAIDSKDHDETGEKPRKNRHINGEPKYGIYVSKVEPNTTSQELLDAFSKYGEIVDMNNRAKTNEKDPKFKWGYALIFFKTVDAMKRALADGEVNVGNQKVLVSEHNRREKNDKSEKRNKAKVENKL
jgi:hypothetical protein